MPFVRPYVRSDGTPVRGHSRWAPGARREMTIVAIFGLAVLGFGNEQTGTGTDSPQPHPPVTYPIRFEHSTNGVPSTAVPRPTVSYPVPFDTSSAQRVVPTPHISYPLDLFARDGER
ncbi:hypothetical protein RKD19_000011 [Streptomyces canus]